MHKDERCLHSEIQEQPKLVCRYTHNIVVMHRYKRTYARAGDGASEHTHTHTHIHTHTHTHSQVMELLNTYLQRYRVTQRFSLEDVLHWWVTVNRECVCVWNCKAIGIWFESTITLLSRCDGKGGFPRNW